MTPEGPGEVYEVRWTPPAQRDVTRLPPRVAGAVFVYVDERLAHAPLKLSKPLHGELAGRRSARNGDYRVLFRVVSHVLYIDRVDHRAHVYRT